MFHPKILCYNFKGFNWTNETFCCVLMAMGELGIFTVICRCANAEIRMCWIAFVPDLLLHTVLPWIFFLCMFFTSLFLSLSHISSALSLFYSSESSEVSSYFRGNKLSVSLCLQLLWDLKAAFLLFSVLVTFSVTHTRTRTHYSDTATIWNCSPFFHFWNLQRRRMMLDTWMWLCQKWSILPRNWAPCQKGWPTTRCSWQQPHHP